jgi:predicted Zn-dependent protease
MVETSPEARLPRQNLGLSFLKRGDYAQARIHLEKAVALGSASLPLQGTLGVVEATLGQRDQGLARALKAAHSDPRDPTLAALVADVHRVRGEQAEALAWLEKGLSLNPGSVEMRLNRAGALIALDRLDEAGAALRETEARLPAAGNTRLTFARLQADLESRRDPAAAAGRWARLVVELRALPERTSAQSLDLAYAERKLAEGARAPRR